MKILWIGDGGDKDTGFCRVTNNVVRDLTARGHEVHNLAINFYGDPLDPVEFPWKVYPASAGGRDALGFDRTHDLYEKINPDVVVLLGDPWVIPFYLERLPKGAQVVAYLPVDAPHQWAGRKLNRLSHAIAYTRFGARELRKGGYHGPLSIVPHGLDATQFYPMDRLVARKTLFPPELHDAFIVGNVNRNSPRKRQDLSLLYFAEWWYGAGKPSDAYLLLHCALEDVGYELEDLSKYFEIDERIIFTGTKDSTTYQPVERLRRVYNALDVQINTGMGEGWGLTTHEGMACGVPQLVGDYSALAEWPRGGVAYANVNSFYVHNQGVGTIGGVVEQESFMQALDKLYRRPDVREYFSAAGRARATEPRFTWSAVGESFEVVLKGVVGG